MKSELNIFFWAGTFATFNVEYKFIKFISENDKQAATNLLGSFKFEYKYHWNF